MSDEKNIRLTLIRPDEDAETVSLSSILRYARRLLAAWLALAVAVGSIALGLGLAFQDRGQTGVTALIAFSGGDAASHPNITEIQMPSIVEKAVRASGLEAETLDGIRTNLHMEGIIPEAAYDRMSLYYNLVLNSKADLTTIQSLLDTGYSSSRYLISFDYKAAKYTEEEGLLFLNALLDAYRSYYNETYQQIQSVGLSLNIIDYREFDYAEAVSIFDTAIDTLTSYVTRLNGEADAGFRSGKTGYSFADLIRRLNELRDTDLDEASSYIVINSVTADSSAAMIQYYTYLVENLQRQISVEKTRLDALTDSIASYEKDPVIIVVTDANSTASQDTDANANYDRMVQEKITTQRQITSDTRRVRYYQAVIDGFQRNAVSSPEEIQKAEEYLSSLDSRLSELIACVRETADEYYEKAAFVNSVRILVPPVSIKPALISIGAFKLPLALEVLLTLCYLGAAAVLGIMDDRKKKHASAAQPVAAGTADPGTGAVSAPADNTALTYTGASAL